MTLDTESEMLRPKITLFGLLVFFGILGSLAALVLPTYLRGQAQGRLSACAKGGLYNIGVALGRYASDHDGLYPNELNQLVPEYLTHIPNCPENEADYVYRTGKVGYNKDGLLDNYYFIYCKDGHPDVGVAPGYPQYDPELGLIER